MSDLKVGRFVEDYKINNLKLDGNVNRDVSVSNIEEKKNKIEEFGWLMPIIITVSGKILEGQNRYEAARSIGLKTIPVYIVDWVNEQEADDVRDVIISLNNGNKAWVQWDYIKSYKSSIKSYEIAYRNCLKYEGILSNGIIVSAMFGLNSMNTRFKKGEANLVNRDKYTYLLETASSLVVKYGKNQFPSQTLRTFVLWANKVDDYNLINFVVNQMKASVKHGQRVADGDLGLREWINLQKEAYESVKDNK